MATKSVNAFDGTKLHVEYSKPKNAKTPTLILNDGLGCSGYAWKHLAKSLRKTHPVIEWHYRGHGKSGVPANIGTMTIECLANDLISVLNSLGVESAISISHSMGVQVALEAYSHYPNRFSGKVLICGGYRNPIATWHMNQERESKESLANYAMRAFFPHAMKAFLDFPVISQSIWEKLVSSELSYHACLFLEVNHRRIKRKDFLPYFKGLTTMQANIFAHIAQNYASHNAQSVLPKIQHPTLIIGGGKDTFCPKWIKEDMHNLIPRSELYMIKDGTHATPIEHPLLIKKRVSRFLNERVLP